MVIDSPGLNLYTFFYFLSDLRQVNLWTLFSFMSEMDMKTFLLQWEVQCKARCLNNESCYLKTLIKTDTI